MPGDTVSYREHDFVVEIDRTDKETPTRIRILKDGKLIGHAGGRKRQDAIEAAQDLVDRRLDD